MDSAADARHDSDEPDGCAILITLAVTMLAIAVAVAVAIAVAVWQFIG